MNTYSALSVKDIKELKKGQILVNISDDKVYEVINVDDKYARLKLLDAHYITGLLIGQFFISNDFIDNYKLLPRT